MKRKVIALLMTAVMTLGVLSGCGSSENVSGNSTATDTKEKNDKEESNSQGGDTEEEDEDTAEIKIALMSFAPVNEEGAARIREAINEMTMKKINTKVDIQWYDAPSYATQVPMMIQAGEGLDLLMFNPVPGSGFQSYMSQNQLLDITEYVDEYGKSINEVMGEYLKATTKDGKVYGVGNLSILYTTESICMRKDVLDELKLTEKAQNMTTWTEYEEILKEVVANTDLNGVINADAEGSILSPQPFINGTDKFSDAYGVDALGDSYYYVYADEETDEVKCYFFSEDWYQNIKMTKRFYDGGLVYKDASTTQDYAETLIKNNVGFSEVKMVEDGALSVLKSSTGYDFVISTVAPGKVGTAAFTKFGFAVPVTSQNPEAAVKFMDLLYGDKEIQDTLTWGVEGVDWVKNDDGTATYPEGVTADTSQYHMPDFLYGNRLNVTPWEGDGADIRERQIADNEKIELSKYFGFSVDTEPVSNEIAACKNIVDQYKPQLSSGIVDDVDKTYQEFKDALSAAGMDKILAEYQSQLDAWLAQ